MVIVLFWHALGFIENVDVMCLLNFAPQFRLYDTVDIGMLVCRYEIKSDFTLH